MKPARRSVLTVSKVRFRALRYWGWAGLMAVLTLGLLLLPRSASAESTDPAIPFEHEIWGASGFWSHHTQHESRYREVNRGLGLEWVFTPQWQLNVGRYSNSVYRQSNYLQAGWMPLDFRWGPLRTRAGASIGVVNGYPRVRNGGYFPAVVPALSVEAWRVGMNVVYIPSVGTTDGAVAAQLKVRLY